MENFIFGPAGVEDIDEGYGTFQATLPDGNVATLSKIGIHEFIGPSFVSAKDFPGADLGAKIANAMAVLAVYGGTVDATGFLGVQTITQDMYAGISVPINIMLGPQTITLTAPQNPTGGSEITGLGRGSTTIIYSPSTGVAFNFGAIDSFNLRDLYLHAGSTVNTAVGLKTTSSDHVTFDTCTVDGFDVNIEITGIGSGTSNDRSFNVKILNCISSNFRTAGIWTRYAVGIVIHASINYGIPNNPTNAWGVIMDTGTSGLYISQFDTVAAGFVIRNSEPNSDTFGFPPEFLFTDQVTSDTVTGTDGILFDSSLGVADGLTRKGKSYHLVNSWAAFTQTANKSGVEIAGGEDISITDFRARLNRYHGVNITGGNNIRLINVYAAGNNQQNAADGDGIQVAANISNFQIIGGASGNNISGESGHQKWNVRVLAGSSANYIISGIDVSQGYETGGLFDGGAGAHTIADIVGPVDNGGGNVIANYSRMLGGTARLEVGDGAFFLDYKKIDVDSVVIGLDTGAYIQYSRASSRYFFVLGSADKMRITANGVGLGADPSASAALDITSTTQGFGLPAMTTTQRNAISSPKTGLVIYNLTTGKVNFYDGVAWRVVTST